MSITRRVSPITGRVSYRVRVFIGKRDGGPRWLTGGTYDRLRAKDGEDSAEAALERLKRSLSQRTPPATCVDTIRVLAERWMRDEILPAGVGNTTRAHRRAIDDHILDVVIRVDSEPECVGDIIAAQLTGADVAEWQASQVTGGRLDGGNGGCSPKSVRNYRGTLHLLFRWLCSVMPETFAHNPVDSVAAPRWRRKAPVPPTISDTQVHVAALADTRYWPALVIGSGGGMRRGEVLALRWSDLHYRVEVAEDGSRHVTGGMQIDAERGNLTGQSRMDLKFGPPKTKAGARYVPLTEDALEHLIAIKAKRTRELALGREWDDAALICCGGAGQPIVPDNLTHGLQRLQQRRKLPQVSFHKLRHMVATEMRRAGVDRDVLAKVLGHADVATTSIYDHVSESDQEAAVAAFQARCEEATERRRAQMKPISGTVVSLRR